VNLLGTALHISKSRRLIARSRGLIPLFSKVYDQKLNEIGVVVDVFGPVKAPYVAIKVKESVDATQYVGSRLYYRPPPSRSRRRSSSRKKRRKKK